MKQINRILLQETTKSRPGSSTRRVASFVMGNFFSEQMPTKRRETNKFETFN